MKHTNKPKVQNEEKVKVHDFSKDVRYLPFNILQKNNKYYIILGNQIVSKSFEHIEDAQNYLEMKPYDLIVALISITMELQKQYEQEQEQLKVFKNENKG